MHAEPTSWTDSFPRAGGETGALMRAHDWERTALGPPSGWPAALKVAVNLILGSPESMFLAWGPDLVCLYNDGDYIPCAPSQPERCVSEI